MTSKELTPSLISSSKTLSKPLTKALRKEALAAGWPLSLTKNIKVVLTETSVDIEYPEALALRIEDLEYGDGSTSPNPVFRNFVKTNKYQFENAFVDTTIDYLFEDGILP